jgi:hypothetical protein
MEEEGITVTDDGVLSVLLERLQRSNLTDEQQLLVLAAFEGADQLRLLIEGEARPADVHEEIVRQPAEPRRAYLRSISVRGFRGIGPEACLPLEPRPGLTIVAGRNGSGKSSFAEGLEAALTGTSFRWAGRPRTWKDGWRNLHEKGSAIVAVDLQIEGDRGTTTVRRTWSGTDVDQSDCWAQRPDQPRTTLSELGWDAALHTYRPFLSYSELGQLIAGDPKDMYDALASILGLEQLSEAEKRLGEERKRLESESKEVDRQLLSLLDELAALDDDRARRAHAALKISRKRLDLAAEIAAGTSSSSDEDALASLRHLARLETVSEGRVTEIVVQLRQAADAMQAVRGTQAEESQSLARLLQQALDHHDRHADRQTCPVCGTEVVLDAAWAEQTRARVEELQRSAKEVDVARQRVHESLDAARGILTDPPEWLADDSPVRRAWAAWAQGATISDPATLAYHLEATFPPHRETCAAARDDAARKLNSLDAAWRPVARRLATWVDEAMHVEARKQLRNDVRKAYDWLRDEGLDLRNERLRPLAEESGRIWQELRQESSVDLGPIRLDGKATRRRVVLPVTVNGVEGAALGVMSQGELHSLALALFLPRATMKESPFGFVVIDDPVQSMDPAKVDGLARVLSKVAKTRQVIVFTHDTRLTNAVRRLQIDAEIRNVVRRENSTVEVLRADDPACRSLKDAHALLHTTELDPRVARAVVPALCRTAVEAVLVDLVWRRRLADGDSHHDVEEKLRTVRKTYNLAALAYFGDARKTGNVLARVNRYGRWAGDTFTECSKAGHRPYAGDLPELQELVHRTEKLVERIRDER